MNEIISRSLGKFESSFFLFGPRDTGKSTWLIQNYPDAFIIDLLEENTFRKLAARPEMIREMILGHPTTNTVVIDEVQKVPEVLNMVHKMIEEHKNMQFILTVSSSRKLKRSGVDLLAGRALLKRMYPFIASELGGDFNLQDALIYGLVPLVYSSSEKAEVLKTYISLFLKEEVQAEELVRNIGSFARFLDVMSFSHGQLLNLSGRITPKLNPHCCISVMSGC